MKNKCRKIIRIYLMYSTINIRKAMEYRVDFVVGMIVQTLFLGAGPVFQYLVFNEVGGFRGWTIQDIIMFQGILLFVLGVKGTFLNGIPQYVQDMVRKGDLDHILLLPYNSLGVIVTRGFSLNNIGTIIGGTIVTIYAFIQKNLIPSLGNICLFLLFVWLGLIFFLSIDILYSTLIVLFVNLGRLNEILDNFSKFGQYPIELFSKGTRGILITIVPMALWVNIPCEILLHGFHSYMILAIIFDAIWLIMVSKMWNYCLIKYTSAGG